MSNGFMFLARMMLIVVAALAVLSVYTPIPVVAEVVTTNISIEILDNNFVLRAEEGKFNQTYMANSTYNFTLTLIRDLVNVTNITTVVYQNISLGFAENFSFSCPACPDQVCVPSPVSCPSVVSASLDNESLREIMFGAANESMEQFFLKVDSALVPSQDLYEICLKDKDSLNLRLEGFRGDVRECRALLNASGLQLDNALDTQSRYQYLLVGFVAVLALLIFVVLQRGNLPFGNKEDLSHSVGVGRKNVKVDDVGKGGGGV